MASPAAALRNIFEVSKSGRIPVSIAHAKVHDLFPSLEKKRIGKLLRATFGPLKRGKPGKSRRNPKPVWVYYGLKLRDNSKEQPVVSSDHQPSRTPQEVKDLKEEVVRLRAEKASLQRAVESWIPQCMKVKKADLPNGKKLGEGTFGRCRLSTYKGLRVAVKTSTNPRGLSDEELRKTYEREAVIMLKLEASVYLPHLIGVCLDDSPYELLVQYGGQVTVMRATQDRALGRVVPWLKVSREIVEGVRAIHRSNIIHNDLKDDNVLLRRDMGFSPLIIDFGKAEIIGSTKPHFKPPKGRVQTYRNRYPWVAPELFQGGHPSVKSDIFALGFILHCITDKRPITSIQRARDTTFIENPDERASLEKIRDMM